MKSSHQIAILIKEGIGNYKGLMICTRPNDKIQQVFNRPFVSRVEAKQQIGLNPAPKIQMNKPLKRIHYVLSKHKQWLEGYKNQIRDKIYNRNQDHLDKISRQERLREQSINLINRRREQHLSESQQNDFQSYNKANHDSFDNYTNSQNYHQDNNPQQNDDSINISPDQLEKILKEPVQTQNHYEEKKVTAERPRPQTSILKQKNKKEKPSWAKTEKQLEDEELQECDDLLNFANTLDYDKYINDLEVQSMVKAIKERVENLKQTPSQQNSYVNADDREFQSQKMKGHIDQIDERLSNQGENLHQEARSNTSAKSRCKKILIYNFLLNQNGIKETVEKVKNEGKEEWDKSTTVGDQKHKSNIEDKLVKHLAEDILKNNKYLRGIHSTNSIKQVLIGEAKKQFQENATKNSQNVY